MFEQDFERLLSQYQDAIEDKQRFTGLVKDFFPGQQMKINLILSAYDLGLAKEINSSASISNALAFRFVKRLMDEYGISRANADWAISTWCICYGGHVLGKPCEIKKDTAVKGPIIREDKTGNLQYGELFSYAASSAGNGYAVTGFSGANKQTIIFQNRHEGRDVIEIKESAFMGCEVQEAILTEGFIRIGKKAFYECSNLRQIIFPMSLKEIGDYAMTGCGNLTTAVLPVMLQQLGAYSLSGTKIKNVQLPRSLYYIGEGAFSDCRYIEKIDVPDNIDVLPGCVFKGCTGITKVNLHEKLHKIGEEAFCGCSGLQTIYVPTSVTEIGENAFTDMHEKFILLCEIGSYAEKYAQQNKLRYQLI